MTDETHPDLPGLTRAASDIISVRRVFGEPYELGGTLVVPVAKVMGWHGVAGAHGDARLGVRGGGARHDVTGSAGQGGSGTGAGGGSRPGGSGDDGPEGRGGTEGPGGPDDGGTRPGAAPEAGHGAHAGAPAPEEDPRARSGPGRGPLLRGPLWPFGAGRPGGRGVGAADAGGYATRVKPLGVFVVDEEGAHWQPALDLNRIILGGQAVGAVATVALAWALRRRRR